MRPLRAPAASLLLLAAGCEPAMDPDVPYSEQIPCHTQADCEIPAAESATRRSLCSSDVIASGARQTSSKQFAACGPYSRMVGSVPEPELACFRGTCVPIGSRR